MPLFLDGAWLKKKNGAPKHHLRVIQHSFNAFGQPVYLIFDTNPARGYADYEWVLAERLEAEYVLVKDAESPYHVLAIRWRCERLRGLRYAIIGRQDCESIQGVIHTGREEDRWSGQVVGGLALLVVVGLWGFGSAD